ncbi:hypothetical protein wTpre_1201 [Wolbachia endosymbiont of Trichogramma pretiosum]|nr:hypothetical protein wTpre_1201 [Wolbachia endosymbiont of Trichogramma pretiosum]
MKIKGLCVLAVLLTSSLAGAASNSAKEQYYAGLKFVVDGVLDEK